jgi:superfamily II DNA or RNA helicase
LRYDTAITLLRSGNRLVVHPTTKAVNELLVPELTYTSYRPFFGMERKLSGKAGESTTYQCFTWDHRNRLATSFGFYDRITRLMKKHGYGVILHDMTPAPNPEVFQDPHWDRIFAADSGISLRFGQDQFLIKAAAAISQRLPARFDCPPGYGKSMIIAFIAMLFPRARIHVTTKRIPVLDRIYDGLRMYLPDVGICCGGKKRMGARVQLFSFDSLHHSTGEADIMICDEAHESAPDDASMQLAKYDNSVNLGFSATHDMRLDNKDMRVEAIFGPVVYKIPYQEAMEHNLVVPMEVIWSDVVMDANPCSGSDNPVDRKRSGVWRNTTRNEIIAADARLYPDDVQTLITCETIEHVLALKRLLPEFETVYAAGTMSVKDIDYFRRQGLWTPESELMTPEKRSRVTKMFELGHLKKAICNTVWNVGVDFRFLEVLLRADAGASPTMDTQIPGRATRINTETDKSKGRIHDYLDHFDHGFKLRSFKRMRNYAKHGWEQFDAEGKQVNPPRQAVYRGNEPGPSDEPPPTRVRR